MNLVKKASHWAACTVLLALPAFSGGFWLQLGNPEANAEARAMKAVVTFMPAGCGDPLNAKVSATAIGRVNGKIRTIPLKVKPLSTPGLYAVAREWPEEGRWVVQLSAKYENRVTSALVPVGLNGAERSAAKFLDHHPEDREIAAALGTN